jgi:signal transduction histidine kinase
MRKATPTYDWINGRLSIVGSTTGIWCRRRAVNGVSTWENEAARDDVALLNARRKAHPWFDHHNPASAAAKLQLWARQIRTGWGSCQVVADDISNFDQTVSVDLMRQVIDDVFVPCGLGPVAADVLRRFSDVTVLTGPFFKDDRAFLQSTGGGLASGRIDTSLLGSMINVGVINDALAAGLNWSPENANRRAGTDWQALIQGDDTALVTPGHMNWDAYQQTAATFGFVRKLEDAPVFLMAHLDITRPDASHLLASRAAARTVTRERRSLGPHVELFGAAVRWDLARDDPFAEDMFQLIADNELFLDFNVRTRADLQRVIRQDSFLQGMDEEIRTTANGLAEWARTMRELGLRWDEIISSDLGAIIATRLPMTTTLDLSDADRRRAMNEPSWQGLLRTVTADRDK